MDRADRARSQRTRSAPCGAIIGQGLRGSSSSVSRSSMVRCRSSIPFPSLRGHREHERQQETARYRRRPASLAFASGEPTAAFRILPTQRVAVRATRIRRGMSGSELRAIRRRPADGGLGGTPRRAPATLPKPWRPSSRERPCASPRSCRSIARSSRRARCSPMRGSSRPLVALVRRGFSLVAAGRDARARRRERCRAEHALRRRVSPRVIRWRCARARLARAGSSWPAADVVVSTSLALRSVACRAKLMSVRWVAFRAELAARDPSPLDRARYGRSTPTLGRSKPSTEDRSGDRAARDTRPFAGPRLAGVRASRARA